MFADPQLCFALRMAEHAKEQIPSRSDILTFYFWFHGWQLLSWVGKLFQPDALFFSRSPTHTHTHTHTRTHLARHDCTPERGWKGVFHLEANTHMGGRRLFRKVEALCTKSVRVCLSCTLMNLALTAHTHTHTHTHTHAHTLTHSLTPTHMYTHVHTDVHTHTVPVAHAHLHKHTVCIPTISSRRPFSLSLLLQPPFKQNSVVRRRRLLLY